MNILKVSFKNKNDELLAGRLELPKNRQPHNYVLFAHCFTCDKNLNAVRKIGKTLTNAGFGVLRFDFTEQLKVSMFNSFWLGECTLTGYLLSRIYKVNFIADLLGQDSMIENRYK